MKREIDIKQHDKEDCGAACLGSVLAYYGLKLPMITLRDACGTSKEGTSMQGIIEAGKKFGMEMTGLKSGKKDPEELREITLPAIIHLHKENGWLHFVVLYKMERDKVVVMDPEEGKRERITLDEFRKEWSGYLICATPSEFFEAGDKSTPLFRRFRELFSFHKKELLEALVGSLAYIGASLSTSLFLEHLIDHVIPQQDYKALILIALAMTILALAVWIISFGRAVILLRTGLKIDFRLIKSYFHKLFSLPVSFFSSRGSGELNSRISDAYRIRAFITGRLLLITISISTLIMATIILFCYNATLTFITVSMTPVYFLLYKLSDKYNRKYSRDILEKSSEFENLSVEMISCSTTLKYFGGEKSALKKIERRYAATANAIYSGGKFVSKIASGTEALGKFISITILIAGAAMIPGGKLTIGELVSFFTLAGIFTSPIMLLIESNKEISEAKIAAQRLFDILDCNGEEEPDEDGHPAKGETGGDITIRRLSFAYPGREAILNNISFTIPEGKITLIKGENGCGKSTLASLLMRSLLPSSGEIRWGGTNISLIPLKEWREKISIVPQRVELFNGTILENIIVDDEAYDREKLFGVCNMSGLIHNIEKMPQGLYSSVGEGGRKMSGGEKSKIALARALYRSPKILIMDEATTYLDERSTKDFMASVKRLKEIGITILLISHEEKINEIADHIITINDKSNAQS